MSFCTRTSTRCFAVLLVGAGIGSCAYLRDLVGLGLKRPQVKVLALDVRGVSLQGINLAVKVGVDNPNDFELKLAQLSYRFDLGAATVATGEAPETLVVPALGRAEVVLPLTIDPSAALNAVQKALAEGAGGDAVLSATAAFSTPVGAIDVAFTDRRPLQQLLGN